jgi:5-methylcytosine-specific restriction endonuclease McrA
MKKMTAQQRAYRKFLRSIAWSVQRSRIVIRANGLCEVCRKTKLKQVHHLKYGEPLASTPDSDLVAVCGHCHRNAHIRPPAGSAVSAEIQLF